MDRWRQRVEPAGAAADFVELAPATTASQDAWELEIALPHGIQLRFRG